MLDTYYVVSSNRGLKYKLTQNYNTKLHLGDLVGLNDIHTIQCVVVIFGGIASGNPYFNGKFRDFHSE